jgi:transposase
MGKRSEVFVALDVAKKKQAVALAEGGRTGEVRFLRDVENSPGPIGRMIERQAVRYGRLHVCFEAGPTGTVFRQVWALCHDCCVVAPAPLRKRSERIKTNRRDSVTLARLHRAAPATSACEVTKRRCRSPHEPSFIPVATWSSAPFGRHGTVCGRRERQLKSPKRFR